jgi:hypothetical protein
MSVLPRMRRYQPFCQWRTHAGEPGYFFLPMRIGTTMSAETVIKKLFSASLVVLY